MKRNSVTPYGRNTNIEVLRFILMVFIFGEHLITHGMDFHSIVHARYINCNNYPLFLFLNSLFAFSVDCFIFISGYYGIRFSMKRFVFLLALMLSAITILQLRWIWMDGFSLRSLDLMNPWYFMNCYLVIFMFAPLINGGAQSLTKSQIRALLVVFIFYETYCFLRSLGYDVADVLIIYLIGRSCSLSGVSLSKKQALFFFAVCLFVLFSLEMVFSFTPIAAEIRLLSYKNPLVIFMAVSCFYFFSSFKPRSIGWLNKALRPCLFIYLLTEGLSSPFLYKFVCDLYRECMVYGIVFSLIILFACLFVGWVLTEISRLVVNKLFNNKWLRNLDV